MIRRTLLQALAAARAHVEDRRRAAHELGSPRFVGPRSWLRFHAAVQMGKVPPGEGLRLLALP